MNADAKSHEDKAGKSGEQSNYSTTTIWEESKADCLNSLESFMATTSRQ